MITNEIENKGGKGNQGRICWSCVLGIGSVYSFFHACQSKLNSAMSQCHRWKMYYLSLVFVVIYLSC